jgi:hypothetical protein
MSGMIFYLDISKVHTKWFLIECLKIQKFNELPIHLVWILREKKEKYGNMGFIFYLVIAHQSKHLKGLDMLLPKKNI